MSASNQRQPHRDMLLLSYFGGDHVTEIDAYNDGRNARIARGQFGEIALAVWEGPIPGRSHNLTSELIKSNGNGGTKAEEGTTPSPAASLPSSKSPDKATSTAIRRVVAIKTLYQAMVPARGRFGKFHEADVYDEDSGSSHEANNDNSIPKQPTHYLMREVHSEIAALHALLGPHPNVVELLAVYPNRDHYSRGTSLSLAFEYCPTDLHFSLEWRRRTFQPLLLSFPVLGTVAADVLGALEHCHSRGVIHCDVKPGNLLVSSQGWVRLCDFGIAHITRRPSADAATVLGDAGRTSDEEILLPPPEPDEEGDKNQPRAMCTLHYRPPELLLGGSAVDPSVDVWSAGVVVAELMTGRALFPGRNAIDQLYRVFEGVGTPSDTSFPAAKALPDYGKLNFNPQPPKPIAELAPRSSECLDLKAVLEACIVLDPERRAAASAILKTLQDGSASSSPTNHQLQARRQLIEELVPRELDEPILLSCLDDATAPVLELAARRRKLLSTAAERACKAMEPTR